MPEGRRRVCVYPVMELIIPVMVSIACLNCLIITQLKAQNWTQKKNDTSIHRLCIPCSLLRIDSNFPVMTTLSKLTVKGQEVCCTNDSETASAFMEMVMSSTDDTNDAEPLKTYNGEDFSFSKASAHKRLTVSRLQSIEEPVFLGNENRNLEFEP